MRMREAWIAVFQVSSVYFPALFFGEYSLPNNILLDHTILCHHLLQVLGSEETYGKQAFPGVMNAVSTCTICLISTRDVEKEPAK